MQHDVVTVRTAHEQIKIFCEFAEKFKTDFQEKDLRKFLDMEFSQLCSFLRSHYCLEKGEQILRPKYFAEISSDCDDATIFCIACFRAAGIDKKNIFLVEAKETAQSEDYVHIFCALRDPETKEFLWFDNLPGTEFNRLDYSAQQIRITPLAKYI